MPNWVVHLAGDDQLPDVTRSLQLSVHETDAAIDQPLYSYPPVLSDGHVLVLIFWLHVSRTTIHREKKKKEHAPLRLTTIMVEVEAFSEWIIWLVNPTLRVVVPWRYASLL